MTNIGSFLSLAAIELETDSEVPMYRQLYEGLRAAILQGRLASGSRLPSSRSLARALSVSRNTVANAYERLLMEGFLEARTGAGTYVSSSMPDRDSAADPTEALHGAASSSSAGLLSDRGRRITEIWGNIGREHYRSNAFRPRLPALDTFPLEVWSRMISRRWRNMPSDMLTYGDPSGYGPLRDILAEYLKERRGIEVSPAQIIIVSGTPQAISLAAAVLLDRGDKVIIEDPGNPRARAVLLAADAELVPAEIDDQGLYLDRALAAAGDARMAYVTPALQYPMGVTMSLARRLELLKWATQTDSWILEDDYGTEFATQGVPLAALARFEVSDRVIYIGTFNDTLFPALRLGYLVVPLNLVDSFISSRVLIDRCPPLLGQVVLADFIADGHLERHMRTLREIYERRRRKLEHSLSRHFGSALSVSGDGAATQLVALLPPGSNDRELSMLAARQDVEAPPLSFYSLEPRERGGFVLGYGAVDEQEIEIGVRRMKTAFDNALARST